MASKGDKYTDPGLRGEVKEEIQAGDKGGKPGQWSARKAQVMASECKTRGSGYITDKDHKDDKAKHLNNWTEEEWQTKEGSGRAKQDDGTEKMHLPKKAWEQVNEGEKENTDQRKKKESKEGKQYVENTPKAKGARKDASKDSNDDEGKPEQSDIKNAKDCTQHWEDAHHVWNGQKKYREFKEQDHEYETEPETAQSESELGHSCEAEENPAPKKRGRGVNQKRSNKKQKQGSSSGEPNGPAGDKTRVPKKGQKVQWHALPGFVNGEVVEVVYEEKMVEGKSVKGSKEDPRVVLKSSSSGKIAVHKPETVYFD